MLGFSPRFFEQVAHESVQVKRVELIPHIGISDPLVQQIGLRWVDNIICPFITGNKERARLGTKVNDNPILPVVVPARMTIWEPLEL